jgi:hypothetical protein
MPLMRYVLWGESVPLYMLDTYALENYVP